MANEDCGINKNISVSLTTDQTNGEENEKDKTQTTLKFLKSKYLAKMKKISKSKNYEDPKQNILQQQDFTQFATTSPIPSIKRGEHFPEVKTCSISLEEDTHLQVTSIDGFFNRKRGRPPKNRFVALYKNTHPKPQAIFTSFKLEKLETKETSEKEANIYFYTDLHTLRDCVNDGNKTSDYSRQKPISTNSTQRKRTYGTMNNNSPPTSIASSETVQTTTGLACETKVKCDHDTNKNTFLNNSQNVVITHNTEKIIPKINYTNWTTASTAHKVHTCVTEESITANSSPCHKFFETTENLTVVRAAGTFYPENSYDTSKFTDFVLKKLQDGHKRVPPSKEVKYRENLKGNAIPQDLSRRETTSSEKSSSAPNLILPQIFITLQMQQQFLAFWQQMVLMAPIFSCVDFKTFANVKEPFTQSNEQDVEHELTVLNMLRNKTNQSQNINVNVKYPTRESELWQAENQTLHTTTTEMLTIGQIRPSKNLTAKYKKQQITSPLVQEDMFCNNGDLAPKGYIRLRSNDDCGFDKCRYRQHQSHFHCNRLNCQYSFCDKTRFVQHSTRHERLDNLMGYDFQQYTAKMSCNIDNCPHFSEVLSSRKSSTHFHCLKCQFVSVDSNKIMAHRRLHNKIEFIRSTGFHKPTSNENCSNTSNSTSKLTQSQNTTNEPPSSENLIITNTTSDK